MIRKFYHIHWSGCVDFQPLTMLNKKPFRQFSKGNTLRALPAGKITDSGYKPIFKHAPRLYTVFQVERNDLQHRFFAMHFGVHSPDQTATMQ